jgi:hypothetical protein
MLGVSVAEEVRLEGWQDEKFGDVWVRVYGQAQEGTTTVLQVQVDGCFAIN